MRVDLHAELTTRDGEAAGNVKAAVIDPYTNEISDFVISTSGLLGRDILVPRGAVERATQDGDAVRLDLSKEELGRLPTYTMEQFVAPPASFVPPAGYAFPPQTYVYPGVIEPITPSPAQSLTDDSENRVRIAKGDTVIDREGETVGVVEGVQFDMECGDVATITMHLSGGFLGDLLGGGETVEIPGTQLDEFWEGKVRLALTKEQSKNHEF